jgi:hypothetical protein
LYTTFIRLKGSHAGLDDVVIHVLEFIKKHPTSEVGKYIRNRVEKRWIHILRTPAVWA